MVGRRARIAMGIAVAVALVALYGMAFKPSLDYVAFMKVEKSSYLKLRMDWLFSIYLVFLVAILVRYLWLLWQLLRGRDALEADVTKASSGL
jgi:TRAP-type C4-dicarboxylate transport system permease small subunit